ncbi:MAG: choice-of-anchor tandem repeat GloVer-containing protein, partial [Candidatus Sulfotelmatobacter sp.]
MMQREAGRRARTRRATVVPFILMSLFVFLASVSQPAQSQTYKVIHNFTGKGKDGATPFGGPVLDHEGNLYGTTYTGGIYGSGSVYRLSPSFFSWKYTSLY